MAALVFSLALPLLISSLFLLSIVTAQQSRAPHGLAFENPMSLSPSAFDFFHPPRRSPPVHASAPCGDPQCAHLAALSAASKARADSEGDANTVWSAPASAAGGIRAGSVAGIVLGVALAVLVAVGASYVVAQRRANSRKASNVIKLDACVDFHGRGYTA